MKYNASFGHIELPSPGSLEFGYYGFMGLIRFLLRLFFKPRPHGRRPRTPRRQYQRTRPRLVPLRAALDPSSRRLQPETIDVSEQPYRFARFGLREGRYLDLSQDGDESRLAKFQLPSFRTPEELAAWLQLPVGKLAWLIHRFSDQYRPEDLNRSHYFYRWLRKRSGGLRLIEVPKPTLKSVQHQILSEILNRIALHESAHGFVRGRSIVTNARPHVGNRVIVKFDLENFYASVRFSRVVAIFRGVGYSREAGIWLARLTTSALPWNTPPPEGNSSYLDPYQSRHLPQGAPTSPALANLSAYLLDVRLSGMARSFGARYTRYADDLTFSGSGSFLKSLAVFLPLVTRIIRNERFRVNRSKRKVIRNNQRQTVTGVVINERTNVARPEYDRLKAILTNCIRHGPANQNRQQHSDFSRHLRGKIAHVQQLNPTRGAKLLELYGRIDWLA